MSGPEYATVLRDLALQHGGMVELYVLGAGYEGWRRVVESLQGEAYEVRIITQLGLVVHSSSVRLSPKAIEFLEEMTQHLVVTREVGQWPGTQLIGDRQGVLRLYRFSPACIETFVRTADRLFAWVNPLLPENPHLLREDGSVLLGSITQEEDAWVELSNNEFDALVRKVPCMMGMLCIRG